MAKARDRQAGAGPGDGDQAAPAGRATVPSPEEDAEGIHDVWSRTASKYRVRAIILLVVNVLLFAGLCCFAYWLRTGVAFAPLDEGYWEKLGATFYPGRDTPITLGSLLVFPINVEEVPMQIVILGLLLAALVSIPIVVAILYRLPACVPFLLAVAFVAMMPWLAITLAGSCVIASARRLRFQFRYASALLGLLLVLIYFYGASRQAAGPIDMLSNPADRIKFVAPWILATVAACALIGFVLLIARLVNYRPGAIAPLMAVMFVTPVILFEYHVGRDELHYRLLENAFSRHFADRNMSDWFERLVQMEWKSREEPRPPREVAEQRVELIWLLKLDERISPEIAAYVTQFTRRADSFLRRYPDSRYTAAVLYLKATALDMRVDRLAFERDRILRFHSDFPTENASRRPWTMLLHNGPNTPMTAVALHRLAVLDARDGDMDQARSWLRTLLETFGGGPLERPASDAPMEGVLTRTPVEHTLGIDLDRVVLEARHLLAFLEHNRDPLYGYQPVIDLLNLNPRSEYYRENLAGLIETYPAGQIEDNIALDLALVTPELDERIALLKACAERYPEGDALAEALYRLGDSYREKEELSEARRYYERLLSEQPDSIWRRPADERLRVLPSPAAEPPESFGDEG